MHTATWYISNIQKLHKQKKQQRNMKLKRNKLLMPIVTRLELLSSCLWKHTCKLLFLVGFATHKHTRVITAACRIRTRSYDHTWQCDYLIAIIDDKLIISSCHLNGNIMRDRTEGGFANCTYPWKPLATPWKPVILNDMYFGLLQ